LNSDIEEEQGRYIQATDRTIYEKPGFKFTADSCGRSVDISKIQAPGGLEVFGTPAEGVRSQTWRGDDTLFVEAVLIENCATRPSAGNYTVQGDRIALSYALHQPVANIEGKSVPIRTACDCPYRLTYEITGLPRADYRVDFSRSGRRLP